MAVAILEMPKAKSFDGEKNKCFQHVEMLRACNDRRPVKRKTLVLVTSQLMDEGPTAAWYTKELSKSQH